LRQTSNGRRAASKKTAIFADPVFSADDPRLNQAKTVQNKPAIEQKTDVNTNDNSVSDVVRSAKEVGLMSAEMNVVDLPRLVYTREIAEILSADKNESFKALDFQASREAALNPDLENYGTIIFATHGLLNSQHPELSGLVLSLYDKNGTPQNGFLRLQDIYNMRLNADLVVLAACETGLGKDIRSEGLVGLTRGFMYAGARRVMASLWKVDEEATVELVKRFYRQVEKGKSPSAALRQAQIEMRQKQRWQSPYFWAGFTLQGDWR
jgi:CHAT domain-containing protein